MIKLLTLSLLVFLFACQTESRKSNPLKFAQLVTKSGDVIETGLAVTPQEQEQGLSGVKPENFGDNQGLLFFNLEDSEKNFWMPDTYFDLDLFYLDRDLKVLDIVRKLPFYIGRANPSMIPRARGVWARHVLEMKASSPVSAKIQIGDTLEWKGEKSLQDTESLIRKSFGL